MELPSAFGVVAYRIHKPSGLSVGTSASPAPMEIASAMSRSSDCLNMPIGPLRFDEKTTVLLSGVNPKGQSSCSSNVRRRTDFMTSPLCSRIPTYTSDWTDFFIVESRLPSEEAVKSWKEKSAQFVRRLGSPERLAVRGTIRISQRFESFSLGCGSLRE